jgi:hypothetical protein
MASPTDVQAVLDAQETAVSSAYEAGLGVRWIDQALAEADCAANTATTKKTPASRNLVTATSRFVCIAWPRSCRKDPTR